jgi:hypothetical protein
MSFGRSIRWFAAALCLFGVGAAADALATQLVPECRNVREPTLAERHTAEPRNTDVTIEWAFEREAEGDYAAAETALLQAARYDHQHLPTWTLANFYYRRGRYSDFWTWGNRASALNPHDFRPLLLLADGLEPNADVVLERLGQRRELLHSYLDILYNGGRWPEAKLVGDLLRRFHHAADQTRLAELDAALDKLPPTGRSQNHP